MSTNNSQLLYALECGHAAPGPPTLVSGLLYCAWCVEQQIIVSVIEYEWRAKCQDCKFSRWAGLSKQNALVMAHGHFRKNPAHKVGPEYIKNPAATEAARKMVAWKGKETA